MSILDQFFDNPLAIINEPVSTINYQNIDFYIINDPSEARTFTRDLTKKNHCSAGHMPSFHDTLTIQHLLLYIRN